MPVFIRNVTQPDISALVALSHTKRLAYEKAQPQFWKHAPGAEKIQHQWFLELLTQDAYIMLVAENSEKIVGFIIGQIVRAPEVYAPDGLTLMIDDFCVESETDWNNVGHKLIEEIKAQGKTKGASQILVVCGAHDKNKREFLKSTGVICASEWYVGNIQ